MSPADQEPGGPLRPAGLRAPPATGSSHRIDRWQRLLTRGSMLAAAAHVLARPAALGGAAFDGMVLAAVHWIALGFAVPVAAAAFRRSLAGGADAPADWRDWTLLLTSVVAASGVASHMALDSYSGAAWSGGLLLLAMALRMPEWLLQLVAPGSGGPPLAARCAFAAGWLALPLTAAFGMALAVDRTSPFLPAGHLSALFGHAHLGLGGVLLLVNVALHLPPRGPTTWIAIGATSIGALGLGATRPIDPSLAPPFATLLAAGAIAFALGLALDRRPHAGPQHVLRRFAAMALTACAAAGLAMTFGDGPGAPLAYGELALLGVGGSLLLALEDVRWITAATWIGGVLLLASSAMHGTDMVGLAGAVLIAFAAISDLVPKRNRRPGQAAPSGYHRASIGGDPRHS